MYPPSVYELTTPSSRSTGKTAKIVQNTVSFPIFLIRAEDGTKRFRFVKHGGLPSLSGLNCGLPKAGG